MKAIKVYLYETCLPRGWVATTKEGIGFSKSNNENLSQFRWRIIKELNKGCIFIFEEKVF